MTERAAYERLLVELARLHERAIERTLASGQPSLAPALARVRSRSVEQALDYQRFRRARRVLMPIAAIVACLGLYAYVMASRHPIAVVATPDPSIVAPRKVAVAASAVSKAADPCSTHVRAAGNQPLIDDFEDANSVVSDIERRVGFWSLFSDNVTLGDILPLTPQTRPNASRSNRYALHAKGPELRDWGAVVQVSFQPACYDASVYDGIEFSARGPGRLYVGVREVKVVPIKWGGTCEDRCYDAHQKKIDLTSQWRRYSVVWSELHQRSYDSAALDPTRVNGIAFLIQAGDTPFDLWLDDIKFVLHTTQASH